MTGRSTRPPRAAGHARPALVAGLTAVSLAALSLGAATVGPAAAAWAAAPASCVLGHSGSPGDTIKHVIYMQFDNVHYMRDDPNVPSDLEQLPNLLHFLTGNGTLIDHEHTPLIAHTADDIVTSETGLYGSDQGIPIANEYNYYKPDGVTDTAGSFAYWTDPIVDYDTGLASTPVGDSSPTLIDASGQNTPAPWVPYTRAGCDFGTVAGADTELENTLPDVPLVFGKNSPEAREAENPKLQNKAEADFDGPGRALRPRLGGVRTRRPAPDVLPDEPGGYPGYQALYGSQVHPAGDQPGRPGAQPGRRGDQGLQRRHRLPRLRRDDRAERARLHAGHADARRLGDRHLPERPARLVDHRRPVRSRARPATRSSSARRTPRSARSSRACAAHGITKANTLFVVTADEGDHFVGRLADPSRAATGCTVTCHYKTRSARSTGT